MRYIIGIIVLLVVTFFYFKETKNKYCLLNKEERKYFIIATVIFSSIIIFSILIIFPFALFLSLKSLGIKNSLSYILLDYIDVIVRNSYAVILMCVCVFLSTFIYIADNNTWFAYCINARFYECLRNYPNAIELYKSTIKFLQTENGKIAYREPTLERIYTRLIKCYMKLGMTDEAKECFEKSLDWIKIEKQEQYKKEILKKYGIS